jgi:WhiB family transcriptional regulator, redox-sensing transcriptional regulator
MTALLVADLAGAACTDADPNLFFAAEAETLAARKAREADARAVCARCPARLPCLEWAMAAGEQDGIWGGVDFGAYYGPLCRSKQHLMDAGNTWIDGSGGTRCRACHIVSDTARTVRRARDAKTRNARDRERYAEQARQQQEEEIAS